MSLSRCDLAMQFATGWQSSSFGSEPGVLKPALMEWAPWSKMSVVLPSREVDAVDVVACFDLARLVYGGEVVSRKRRAVTMKCLADINLLTSCYIFSIP